MVSDCNLFQLFEMKFVTFVTLFALAFAFASSCDEVAFRGYILHCCQNGSYVVVGGNKVWSQAPSVCPQQSGGVNLTKLFLVVAGCVCCCQSSWFTILYLLIKFRQAIDNLTAHLFV